MNVNCVHVGTGRAIVSHAVQHPADRGKCARWSRAWARRGATARSRALQSPSARPADLTVPWTRSPRRPRARAPTRSAEDQPPPRRSACSRPAVLLRRPGATARAAVSGRPSVEAPLKQDAERPACPAGPFASAACDLARSSRVARPPPPRCIARRRSPRGSPVTEASQPPVAMARVGPLPHPAGRVLKTGRPTSTIRSTSGCLQRARE